MGTTFKPVLLPLALLPWCLTFESAAQPKKDKPEIRIESGVTAEEIVRVFRTNAAAADERFSFKRVQVSGKMLRVCNEGVIEQPKKGQNGVRYDLEMVAEKNESAKHYTTDAILHFHTSEAQRAELAKLQHGQLVIMEGVPERLSPGSRHGGVDEIHFFNCKVIGVVPATTRERGDSRQ